MTVLFSAGGFKQAYRAFCEGGWNGLRFPEQYGGQGLCAVMATVVDETWHAASMSFALCPMPTNAAVEALLTAGSDEMKATSLSKLVSGEWTGTMNLTEPGAGSDLAAIQAKAIRQSGGSYRISGQKIFSTDGELDLAENIIHLVLAGTPDAPKGMKGISLFVVPRFLVNSDGTLGTRNEVRCGSVEHKPGIHGSPTAAIITNSSTATYAAKFIVLSSAQITRLIYAKSNSLKTVSVQLRKTIPTH